MTAGSSITTYSSSLWTAFGAGISGLNLIFLVNSDVMFLFLITQNEVHSSFKLVKNVDGESKELETDFGENKAIQECGW